jgi:hypothetical protein
LYISPKLEKDKRLELVLSGDLNKDLIILGSSRGARNIIAGQIQDSLNISSFNLSYPGSDIEFHEFLLRSLIKHNKTPKLVLLAVDDPIELFPNESLKFRLDRLYPLAKYNYINNEMIRRGEKNLLSKFLILARINKQNFDLRKKQFSILDSLLNCDSMPIGFQRENVEFRYNNNVIKYNVENEIPSKIVAFNRFQELCETNQIKLFIVYSPNFQKHNVFFENRIKELSRPSTKSIIYNLTDSVYMKKNHYYDKGHLKINGAKIFTNDIIRQLRDNVIPL